MTALIQLPEYDGSGFVGVVKLRWRTVRFLQQRRIDLYRVDQLHIPFIVGEKIRYRSPPYWLTVQSQ